MMLEVTTVNETFGSEMVLYGRSVWDPASLTEHLSEIREVFGEGRYDPDADLAPVALRDYMLRAAGQSRSLLVEAAQEHPERVFLLDAGSDQGEVLNPYMADSTELDDWPDTLLCVFG